MHWQGNVSDLVILPLSSNITMQQGKKGNVSDLVINTFS
jgi:hypothetical protein